MVELKKKLEIRRTDRETENLTTSARKGARRYGGEGRSKKRRSNWGGVEWDIDLGGTRARENRQLTTNSRREVKDHCRLFTLFMYAIAVTKERKRRENIHSYIYTHSLSHTYTHTHTKDRNN